VTVGSTPEVGLVELDGLGSVKDACLTGAVWLARPEAIRRQLRPFAFDDGFGAPTDL
jgi:hypothetical protein